MDNKTKAIKDYLDLLETVVHSAMRHMDNGEYDDAWDDVAWVCDNSIFISDMIKEVKK